MARPTSVFVTVVIIGAVNILSALAAPVQQVVSNNASVADDKLVSAPENSHQSPQQLSVPSSPSGAASLTNETHRKQHSSKTQADVDAASAPSNSVATAAAEDGGEMDAMKESALSSDDRAPADDVNELGYDDVDELLANQNAALYDSADDDEALLEQLFTPKRSKQYDADVSPRAMAEYLLLTGDFSGVQLAVEDLVSSGILTPSEAERFRDSIGLEYATMAQQSYLTPRQQRDSYRLQNPYEAEDRMTDVEEYPDYEENSAPTGVLLPVLPAQDDVMQQPSYLPADPETMSQIDSRFLEELLLQQHNEQFGDSVEDDDEDERMLQNIGDETQRVPVSAIANDVITEDGQASLETELESLPASDQRSDPSRDDNDNDNVEEELEHIGKLLRNTEKQGAPNGQSAIEKS